MHQVAHYGTLIDYQKFDSLLLSPPLEPVHSSLVPDSSTLCVTGALTAGFVYLFNKNEGNGFSSSRPNNNYNQDNEQFRSKIITDTHN